MDRSCARLGPRPPADTFTGDTHDHVIEAIAVNICCFDSFSERIINLGSAW